MPVSKEAKSLSNKRYAAKQSAMEASSLRSLKYYHAHKEEMNKKRAMNKQIKKAIDEANLMNLLGIEVPVPNRLLMLLESLPKPEVNQPDAPTPSN